MADQVMIDQSMPNSTASGAMEPVWGAAAPGDYWACMKPRVMTLVVFTALVGLIVAPGGIHPILAAASVVLIAIGAGASASLNMWYDADIDRVMKRTAARPTATGIVTPSEALGLGLFLSVFSVMLLGLVAGVTAAVLLATTIAFYAIVYTMWLKRRTPQNIVIGGAAGAFPPMIGWAVVTDSITLASISLFLIIFMWTPAHFWALSLFVNTDYEEANVPMLTVSSSRKSVANQIVLYGWGTFLVSLLPYVLDAAGPLYAVVALLTGVKFVSGAYRVKREIDGAEKGLFLYSISYLFIVFGALAIDSLIMEFLV